MQEVRSNISCALINMTMSPHSYYPDTILPDRPVWVSGTVRKELVVAEQWIPTEESCHPASI